MRASFQSRNAAAYHFSGFCREEAILEKSHVAESELASLARVSKESKKENKVPRFSEKMMSAMACSSKASGHCEQINGTTIFFSFPCSEKEALRKGTIVICTLAEGGQRPMSDSHNSNDAMLSTVGKEHLPKHCRKVLKTQMVE